MSPHGILVVEDESIVARDLQSRLQRIGYTVSGIASTAEDAIRKTRELQPDLVLMDIGLKGPADGVTAATEIRKFSSASIVFLTAYSDGQTLERAKSLNPAGYLGKPLEERELSSALRRIFAAREKNNDTTEPADLRGATGDNRT